MFADPTNEEEMLLTGVVTVVLADDDKIAAFHKPGTMFVLLFNLELCRPRKIMEKNVVLSQVDHLYRKAGSRSVLRKQ